MDLKSLSKNVESLRNELAIIGVKKDPGTTGEVVVQFVVPGTPVAKARPRYTQAGRRFYNPSKTKIYEAQVWAAAYQAMKDIGASLTKEAVSVGVVAFFPVPASRKRTTTVLSPHTTRPDIDNILKSVLDGLTGVVFANDTQVVDVCCRKEYAAQGSLQVTVSWGDKRNTGTAWKVVATRAMLEDAMKHLYLLRREAAALGKRNHDDAARTSGPAGAGGL